MLAAGACFLMWLSVLAAGRAGLPRGHVAALMLVAFYAGLAGARALFVLETGGTGGFPARLLLSPTPGGFSSFGGLFAGLIAAAGYCRLARLPLGRVSDCAAVGLCVFGSCARVGCYLAGCCHGRPTPGGWGVVFPTGSPAAVRWGEGVAVFPTQLLEAACFVTLSLIGSRLLWRRNDPARRIPLRGFPGEVFLLLLTGYGAFRFSNEFLRGDTSRLAGGWTLAQYIALVVVAAALLVWRWMAKKSAGQRQPAPSRTRLAT